MSKKGVNAYKGAINKFQNDAIDKIEKWIVEDKQLGLIEKINGANANLRSLE